MAIAKLSNIASVTFNATGARVTHRRRALVENFERWRWYAQFQRSVTQKAQL